MTPVTKSNGFNALRRFIAAVVTIAKAAKSLNLKESRENALGG
jgi:hypothetical protein